MKNHRINDNGDCIVCGEIEVVADGTGCKGKLKPKAAGHTPTPWRVNAINEIIGEDLRLKKSGYNATSRLITNCQTVPALDRYEEKLIDNANASFIVRCVNSHEELLEACKKARNGFYEDDDHLAMFDAIKDIEKALTKAEKK